jgi:hypothetical protein
MRSRARSAQSGRERASCWNCIVRTLQKRALTPECSIRPHDPAGQDPNQKTHGRAACLERHIAHKKYMRRDPIVTPNLSTPTIRDHDQ